jgi:AraC family transcriptional activator of pobA
MRHSLFTPSQKSKSRYSFTRQDNQIILHNLESIAEDVFSELKQPMQLRNFELLWIKEGSGTFRVDESCYLLKKDSIFLITPGSLRAIENIGSLKGYYLSFAMEFVHLTYGQYDTQTLLAAANHPVISFQDHETALEFDDVMRRLLKVTVQENELQSDFLKGYLNIALTYVCRELNGHADRVLSRNKLMLHQFLQLIRDQYHVKKNVSEYASDLCVTKNYLNSVVKKLTGVTASGHIQRHVVMEAKRQAMYSGLCMKEIGARLGFTDMAHFSKYFKAYAGTNFTDFRRNSRFEMPRETA